MDEIDEGDGRRLGELWEQLPAESRTVRRLSPDTRWDDATWLLWKAEFTLRLQLWASTYDKKRPQPKPKPLETPKQIAEARRRRDNALAAKAEIMASFGMTDEE